MARLYDLYIINRDGLCLLHQKFAAAEGESESSSDSDLVGGFFSAIQQFMQDVLPGTGDALSIKSLDRGDFKLLIEHRPVTDIFGIAVSEKEDIEVRRQLIEIIREFEICCVWASRGEMVRQIVGRTVIHAIRLEVKA